MTEPGFGEGCAGTLETARLRLRAPIEADAAEIARLVNDWEVVRFTAQIPFPYEPEMALQWMARTALERLTGQNIVLAIESQARGDPARGGRTGDR